MKPGFKTSEFVVTVISQLIGSFIITHNIPAMDAQTIQSAIESVVAAGINFIAAIYMLYTAVEYIRGRNALKKSVTGEPK